MDCIFETAHLRIRTFTAEDAPSLFQIHAEDAVKKWIPNESYKDIEETRRAIRFYADCVNHRRLPYVLAVTLKETGELIGDTGINSVRGTSNEVEIGYVICRKHSGKGYATELLSAMTGFADESFGIGVLYGRVMRGNDASVRVLEKNGFAFVREETGAEDDPCGNGMLIYQKECKNQFAEKPNILKTQRLYLRNLCHTDADTLFCYRNDSRCNLYQRYEDTGMEALQAFVRNFSGSAFLSLEEEQHYAIVCIATNEMIGDLSIFFSETDNCFTLGITIAPPFQTQGYAYELLRAVVAQIQNQYPSVDIVALIEKENEKSIRLFKKLGFVEECYAESIQSYVFTIYGQAN